MKTGPVVPEVILKRPKIKVPRISEVNVSSYRVRVTSKMI